MWKILFLRPNGVNNPKAFVFYWYLLIDETANVSIYTQEMVSYFGNSMDKALPRYV
jgi:hypothetical protein